MKLTVNVDKVGEEEIKLSDWDVDVVGIDAEIWVKTIGRLLQSLAIGALQRNSLEQDHLDKI